MSETGPEIHTLTDGGLTADHILTPLPPAHVAPTHAETEENTLKVSLVPLACWRADDLRFDFESSFVSPDISAEMQALKALFERHTLLDEHGTPSHKPALTVFGHADPTGDDDFNKNLSGRRAQVIYGLLIRDPDLWEDLHAHPLGNDKWGDSAIRTMLETTAPDHAATADQIRAHHQNAGLRKKLFLAYMDALCGHDFKLQKDDFLASGADAKGKGDYQGCGEFNPVMMFSAAEQKEFSKPARKSDRDRENAINRRVVIFLFRPGVRVDIEAWPCPRVKEGGAGCKKRFWSDADQRRKFQAERRTVQADQDTFACRFYERLSNNSPCESLVVERSMPTFFTIEQPGATNFVRMHSLWTYVVHYRGESAEIEQVKRFMMREGKLFDVDANLPGATYCNREAWLYFSHRDDLLELEQPKFFARDKSGLPLLGPIRVPCGPEAKVELDIWQQKDWVIVRGPRVDGERPGAPLMADWREDYSIGQLLPLREGGLGFFPHGDQREKLRQEHWKQNQQPIPLVHLGNPGTNPLWAGTLTALPTPKAKVLLMHPTQFLSVGSYNELAPTGNNQDLPGHHRYNRSLVNRLLSVPRSGQPPATVDGLPAPPARVLLPGDLCWQDQGQTNNCGAYSFSTAMNYWMPYTNNPLNKDGALYSKPGNVDDTINGARTPKDIVNAAGKFRMNGRDNDAEDLDRDRAIKMLKLWLMAGTPVVFLVEEEYGSWNLHWKTLVGYDGNRFFMNNSGADAEVIRAKRTPGVEYEHAPVGNDVDSASAFHAKWRTVGTGPLGAPIDLFTSVDACTFIPLFPTDPMFAGDSVV
jgi:hypothetical protein